MGTTRDSRMRIVIEVQNSAAGEIRKVSGELASLERATGSVNEKQKSFLQTVGGIKTSLVAAGAAIAGAALTIKKAWDFAEEGASIERLQIATSGLAESMGGDMSRIVNAVKAASNGTVSDYAIMQASGRAMMLGLGADATKLANLMQVAMFRGRAMGLSGEQAFSDIVTGVGRLSPLILDNLGIVLDAEKTYTEYAATVGKTADSLSGAEKRQALLNRVLEEGNRMMAEAGGLADDSASSFERLSAAWQNAGNRLKSSLGEAFAPTADRMADMIDPIAKLQGLYGDLGKTVFNQSLYYDQYRASAIHAAEAVGLVVDEQGRLVKELGTRGGIIKQVIDANYLLGRSYYNLKMDQGPKIRDDSFMEKVIRERADYSAKVKPFMIDTNAAKALNQVSIYQAAEAFSAAEASRKINELSLFMQGPVRTADEAYIQRSKQLKKELSETGKKLEELRKTPWKKEELAETEQQFKDIQGQISGNAQEHSLASKRILFDLASQRMAQDGLTAAEADAQVALAEKFGLIDQATAQMWQSLKGPVDQMSAGELTAAGWLQKMEQLATTWEIRVQWIQEGDPPWGGSGASKPRQTRVERKTEQEFGFATGGSFVVPGTGGVDSQKVSFYATPGEHVTVSPPGKRGGAGGMTLKNYGNIYVNGLDEFANYG